MDQKKKFGLMGALIYFVIFVAYNLIVFMVFRNFNTIFWISYAFMLLAFFIHIGCVFFVAKDTSVKAFFFGIPLISFSIYFVCAEFFCSFVFMLFRGNASVKACILVQALLLCLYIVIAIVSIMTRDVVSNTDKKIKESVGSIKGMTVDVEMLSARCADVQTKAALNKLSEIIKYSDPMSNSAVELQDQMIRNSLMELRMAFDSGDMGKTQEICKSMELLFVERNKKLMATK